MDADWDMDLPHSNDYSLIAGPPRDRYLPAEIWHSIFTYPDLTRQDIRNLTLTSHQFRVIAQPFLFTSFTISRIMGRGSYSYQTDHYLGKLTHRLTFAKSPAVVGAIRKIVLRQSFEKNYRVQEGIQTVPDQAIVATLFSSIPSLYNLRVLSLEWLRFNSSQLVQLSSLPNLRELHLSRCFLDQSVVEIPDMALQKVSFSQCSSQPWWLPLVRPDTCQELQLHALDDCMAAFAAFQEETRTFAIETIRLHCYAGFPLRHTDLVIMLTRMPYIRSFVFSYPEMPEPRGSRARSLGVALPNELLRLLTSITAPVELLNTFSGDYDRPVRRLVTTFDYTHPMRGGIPFTWICDAFPQLEHLSMHGPENFWMSQDVWGAPYSLLGKLKVLHLSPRVISIGCVPAVRTNLRNQFDLPLILFYSRSADS